MSPDRLAVICATFKDTGELCIMGQDGAELLELAQRAMSADAPKADSAQPGGAMPPFWWTRGHRTHPPRPFATKMHDAHWLVRHEDGTLDTFAYETPDLYVAEGESVVEYRRVAATKADAREDEADRQPVEGRG